MNDTVDSTENESIAQLEDGRRPSILFKFTAIAISILISLIAIELILRLFFPVYQTSILAAYEYDEELGTRLRPGVHLFKTTDFQEEVRVNQLGTVNFQEDFSKYESLIFAAGDSFTQGTGLPSDMSYPAQLDMKLNQNDQGVYANKYGVVNLGLAAFGGEQSLIALRRYASKIKAPNYVLYLGCDNDYEDDVLFKSGYRHKHIVQGSPQWGWMVRPMQWLTNDLQLGLRIKLAVSRLRRSKLSADDSLAAQAETASVAELELPVLEKLTTFAKENNAVLVVSWSETGRSYDWLKQWSNTHRVAFADWGPKVESVKSSIPALPVDNQHSGAHHRGWVNGVIADEYARQITSATRQE